MLTKLAAGALLVTLLSTGAAAQNASTAISNATKAMGAEGLKQRRIIEHDWQILIH